MPEKCALSHGSGVLGRDPRDSYRFWSPHVEKVCTVPQIRLGEGAGGYHWGGVGEPRTGIIHTYTYIYIYIYRHLLRVCIFSICINMYVCAHKHTQVSACMLTPTIAKESKSRAKNQLLRGKGGLQEPKNLPLPPANGSFRKFRVPYFGVLIIMRILLFRALY